jgi:hypothetical protein
VISGRAGSIKLSRRRAAGRWDHRSNARSFPGSYIGLAEPPTHRSVRAVARRSGAWATAALMPSWASEITGLTPRRPRRASFRKNSVQKVSASEGPISMPSTSRRPSLLTPTATLTATGTMRPPARPRRAPSRPAGVAPGRLGSSCLSAAWGCADPPSRRACPIAGRDNRCTG